MRSEEQLADIINRCKVGYVIYQQKLPQRRREGYFTYEQNKYIYGILTEARILLFAIQFPALSLKQRNLLADKLEALGMVAKSNAQTNYVQMAYNDEIIMITR
jgi:hypothetical protein